jgi:hypothetical protein
VKEEEERTAAEKVEHGNFRHERPIIGHNKGRILQEKKTNHIAIPCLHGHGRGKRLQLIRSVPELIAQAKISLPFMCGCVCRRIVFFFTHQHTLLLRSGPLSGHSRLIGLCLHRSEVQQFCSQR